MPVVKAVTVKMGHESYQLVADNRPPFSIPVSYKKMFGAFVQKILHGAPAEPVEWLVLARHCLKWPPRRWLKKL